MDHFLIAVTNIVVGFLEFIGANGLAQECNQNPRAVGFLVLVGFSLLIGNVVPQDTKDNKNN